MIREHLSDPLWSSSTNRMSNKSISEIKLLKEQAMKERHKKATAQAASQAFKRFDGMFNIEPRRPQDESFLSTTIKHVLGDYSTFINLIEAKETAQYLGLDSAEPGTPEVKDIEYENNGYTNLMKKNGFSSHSAVPLKKTLENIKIENHTFLEPTKTSNGPENDQTLTLRIPSSNSTSNHITNNKHSQGKTPNEVESILKEMTQGLPPLLTEIQTPRSDHDFFSFPSKVNVVACLDTSACLDTVDLSINSSANSLSKDVSHEYVMCNGLNNLNNMSKLKESKSCDDSKNKKLQDKTKSRKVSVSSSSSSNSESSSTSESESEQEDQATQCYISSDNFQGNSTNNNYLDEKVNPSIISESCSTLNSHQIVNSTNDDLINIDYKISPLNKKPLSILEGANFKNFEDSFHIGMEKTVSPISELSFDDLDLPYNHLNNLYHHHDESENKNNNSNTFSYLKIDNTKNYNQDCKQPVSNDLIYTNNDVRNAASNKINETKDKNKTKSTRTSQYNTDTQRTLPNPLFTQTSIESTLYIVDQYTESSLWAPHLTPLHNSPVLSQLLDNINTDCTINTNNEIYVSPQIDNNVYVVTENNKTNIETNKNKNTDNDHDENKRDLEKNIIEVVDDLLVKPPCKLINDDLLVKPPCKLINDDLLVKPPCKLINDSQNVTQELNTGLKIKVKDICKNLPKLNNSIGKSLPKMEEPDNCHSESDLSSVQPKLKLKTEEPNNFYNESDASNVKSELKLKMEETNNFHGELDTSCVKPELKSKMEELINCYSESDTSSVKPKLKSKIEELNHCRNESDTSSIKLKLKNERNSLVVKIPLKKIKLKAESVKGFQNIQNESVKSEEINKTNEIHNKKSPKRKLIDDDSDSCSESAFKLPHSSKFDDDLLVKINLSRLKRNPMAKTIPSEAQSDLNITPIKTETFLDNDEEASSDCSSNSITGLKKKRSCPLIDNKIELKKTDKVDVKRCIECGILNADSGKDPIKLSGYKVYRPFLNEGVMKKRKADNLKNPMERAHTYTEAVLNYIRYLIGCEVAGKLMTKQGIDELMRICSDCIRLIDFVVELCRKKMNDSNRSDRRFLFLCFRLQSSLHMKLFKTRSDSVWKVKKIMTDYFTQYKPLSRMSSKSAEGNASTPLTSSPNFGPSPGRSVGSNGSAGSSSSLSSNDSKTGLSMVSIPSDMHEKSLQYLEFTKHIIEAHRLWSNAEMLIPYCEEFIVDVTRKAGPLTLYSSLAQMVDYMTFGLQIILDSPHPS